MRKMISFCHLMIIGVLAWSTTVSSTPVAPQKSDFHMMFENNWPDPDPNINRFPHQASCHYYYLVLSEEDISIRKCHDDKLFDYVVHKCVEKESANCWSRHFAGISHNHHLLHKTHKNFKCPYAYGKFPDITDCTRYYQCLTGKAKSKKCAPYEYFDKIERKCMAEIEAVCADDTDVVEHGYKCPRTWGSFSFSRDCSKYYECIEKRPDLMTCPKHKLFDEKKMKCISRKRVRCGSRHNPYVKETTSILLTPTSVSTHRPTEKITEVQKVTSQTSSQYASSSFKPLLTTSNDIEVSSIVKLNEMISDDNGVSKGVSDIPFQGYNIAENGDFNKSREFSDDHEKDNSMEPKDDSHNENVSKVLNTPEDQKLDSSVNANEFITTMEITPSDKSSSNQETVTASNSQSSTDINSTTKDDKECLPDDPTCIRKKDRIIRCPAPNGLFPHPEDERRFLQCDNLKIYVKTCPEKLIFKDYLKACSWPLKLAQKWFA